ncbi:uncharacterized protein LOC129959330 [Argiope bruennichi]|uniref:uncharacterized protein LOC129959330 n=1 Tax=Argiope bruennichi TaxID=94029 RepID=UPI00249552B0|nr:uncharacterized protein LOC129959330 [Argiope bruennichi]
MIKNLEIRQLNLLLQMHFFWHFMKFGLDSSLYWYDDMYAIMKTIHNQRQNLLQAKEGFTSERISNPQVAELMIDLDSGLQVFEITATVPDEESEVSEHSPTVSGGNDHEIERFLLKLLLIFKMQKPIANSEIQILLNPLNQKPELCDEEGEAENAFFDRFPVTGYDLPNQCKTRNGNVEVD